MLFIEEALNICNNSSVLKVIMFLSSLLKILFILVPIGLIVMISVDFAKNVIAGNDDDMKKNVSIALKRILMAGVLFFVPVIVNFAINILGENDVAFAECFTNANAEKIAELENLEDQRRKDEEGNRVDTTVPDLPEGDSLVSSDSSDSKVHFLGFGGSSNSDCIIIESDGEFAMIDTSYESSADKIVEYLEDLGATELEFVLISHAHIDHISGYNGVSQEIPIKNLYIKVNSAPRHGGYGRVMRVAERDGTTIKNPAHEGNSTIELGSITFRLYNIEGVNYSVSDNRKADNANSLVAVADINGVTVYFSGDIGDYTDFYGVDENTEVEVAKEIGQVDVYKAAHHGYMSYNNQVEALEYLNPTYVVFTNVASNVNGVTERIKSVCSNFKERYITGDGDVIMSVSSSGEISFEQLSS